MVDDIEQPNNLVVRGPYACVCKVRAAGYEWDADLRLPPESSPQDAGNQPSPWLVGGFLGIAFDGKLFQPLNEPDLHRQFGRLKPTRKAIKRFADRCGLLEDGEFLVYPDLGRPQAAKFGESLQFWQREIEMMGALLDLWDYVQYGKKVDGLDIVWHPQPIRISLDWHYPGGRRTLHSIAHEGVFSEKQLIEQIYKEAISPARYYLHERLEERLKGHLNPLFSYCGAEHVLVVPDGLLSALYLSFMLEVDEQPEPNVLCKCGCGREFPPGHGRKFYDEDCKKRDWWRRKRGRTKLQAKG